MLSMLKRCFLLLYGKADSRYAAVEEELEGKDGNGGILGDLDRQWHFDSEAYDVMKDEHFYDYSRSDRL